MLAIDELNINALVNYARSIGSNRLVVRTDPKLGNVAVVEKNSSPKLILLIGHKRCKTKRPWIGVFSIELLEGINDNDVIEIELEKQIDQTHWLVSVNEDMHSYHIVVYGASTETH